MVSVALWASGVDVYWGACDRIQAGGGGGDGGEGMHLSVGSINGVAFSEGETDLGVSAAVLSRCFLFLFLN